MYEPKVWQALQTCNCLEVLSVFFMTKWAIFNFQYCILWHIYSETLLIPMLLCWTDRPVHMTWGRKEHFQNILSSFSSRLRSWSSSLWSVDSAGSSLCLCLPSIPCAPRVIQRLCSGITLAAFLCCGAQGHWILLFSQLQFRCRARWQRIYCSCGYITG